MSSTTMLGITPNRLPIELAEYRNGHGWSPSIWNRLVKENYGYEGYVLMGEGEKHLDNLWRSIEELPEWQQAPLVLTFDTGVIPLQAYQWAAEQMDEFERRCPEDPQKVNHVPAAADLLRSMPEVPWVGVHGTSVSEDCFTNWDEEAEEYVPIPFTAGSIYVLERHRQYMPTERES